MRAELKIIFTYRYEIKPENYYGVDNPEEMLAIDAESARDIPELFMDDSTLSVETRLLKEG